MEKDLQILQKYESWFHSAIYSDYIRALWKSDFDVLIPIYEKWTNIKVDTNFSCGKCKLNLIKKLGKLYYKNKEEYEKQSEQKARESKEIQCDKGRASDGGRQSKRSCNITGQRRQPKANKGTKK